MEPITTAISSYLMLIGNEIQDHYRKQINLDITPITINYKNSTISFQHQLWRINNESVCIDYKQDSTMYASCTVKAKSLFNEICSALSQKEEKSIVTSRYQRMYCNAAIKFQPLVASISSGSNSKIPAEEKVCNQLILKASVSKDKKLIAERDKACQKIKSQ